MNIVEAFHSADVKETAENLTEQGLALRCDAALYVHCRKHFLTLIGVLESIATQDCEKTREYKAGVDYMQAIAKNALSQVTEIEV